MDYGLNFNFALKTQKKNYNNRLNFILFFHFVFRYFFRPNWSLLYNANVWINAAAQNFNSLGIAFGSMISFASYNKYNNNFLHDTLAVSFVNAITSLLVGIFAFATIGNIAYEQSTNVEDVISDGKLNLKNNFDLVFIMQKMKRYSVIGPGLIFVVYPQAISKMPLAQMWAVLFFFMLLCLGLNSQVSGNLLRIAFIHIIHSFININKFIGIIIKIDNDTHHPFLFTALILQFN